MKLFASTILTIGVCALVMAQTAEIDFRTTDAKGLTPSQQLQYERSRERFFERMMKTSGSKSETKSVVIQGNKIHTIIYNTGSISRPGITPNVLDLVWNGLGYGYEFGPLVGCKVPKANSTVDSLKIVSEGFDSPSDGEYGADGTKWGWLPKTGYSATGQNDVASWGARAKVNNDLRLRPPSWPESWYNATLGMYVYPSYLGGNSTVPDEEVYYVVDDYTKKEFDYYPSPSDSLMRGLGLNLEVRTFQFSNPLAEDIIFLVYTAENSSEKVLNKVFFGMFGDPHIGGANNYADDAASFIPARQGTVFKDGNDLTIVNGVLTSQRSRNLVYAWDPDNKSDVSTIPPGYFGYKFLESPNNSSDGIDNDDDGIKDESPFNDKGYFIDGASHALTEGIDSLPKYTRMYGSPKPRWSGDENGNWDPARDDLGIDGIAGTHDEGEGNGVPDQKIGADGTWLGSEPNFGFRDVNESDQIGLKSFWALVFGGNNRPKNDILMYDKISADMDTSGTALLYPPTAQDNIYLYGCGPFDLHHGDRQRFSIALMMGANLNDLLLNSEVAQRVLEANYRFAQPPPKPRIVAVPGDKRVTLYWDTGAEDALDPLTNVNDFEGYKIYRSEDFTFKDVYTITDGNGLPFIGQALYDDQAQKRAQWHLPWTTAQQSLYTNGFHPAEYQGRAVKYYMGEPTDVSGLRHQYVDSTITNGKTYYYAVVSFDHGAYNDSLKLPPTECQAIIQRDAVTQEFQFDVNTVAVIPGGLASGIISPKDDIQKGRTIIHTTGAGTGSVQLHVLDEPRLGTNAYALSFSKIKSGSDSVLTYSLLRSSLFTETFVSRDTQFVSLMNRNIVPVSVQVFNASSVQVPNTSLRIDSSAGQVRGLTSGVLARGQTFTIKYQYYPIQNSLAFKNQDANQVVDGVRLFVGDDPLVLDTLGSGFIGARPTGITARIGASTITGGGQIIAPLDLKITFLNSLADTTASGDYSTPADSLLPTAGSVRVKTPFKIENITDTSIKVTIRVLDNGKKGRWDVGDELVVVTPPPYNLVANNIMMGIFIQQRGTTTPAIAAGTIYVAKTRKPFTKKDAYTMATTPISYDAQAAASMLNKIYVVPNPYVVSSQFELPANQPDHRGGRALQFRNLPEVCTIRIYTLTGELVQTLHKDDLSSYLSWDVLSSESARLAYGVYIYQVETPAGGSKIGRFALIK